MFGKWQELQNRNEDVYKIARITKNRNEDVATSYLYRMAGITELGMRMFVKWQELQNRNEDVCKMAIITE